MRLDEEVSFSKDEIKEMLSSKTEYIYIDPVVKKLKSRQNWLAVLGFILGKVLLYGIVVRNSTLADFAGWISLGTLILGILLRVILYDTMFKKTVFWMGLSMIIGFGFAYFLIL